MKIKGYFLNSGNLKAFDSYLEQIVAVAKEFILNNPDHKIQSNIAVGKLRRLFLDSGIPVKPKSFEHVIHDIREKILKHSVHLNEPKFIGHMTGAVPYFGLLADILISALNQNVVKSETGLAASFVERQTLGWMHRLIFQNSKEYYHSLMHSSGCYFGNVTNGGTLGNLTALTVARDLTLPNIRSEGMYFALKKEKLERLVIICSQRSHYSITKIAILLGLGENNVLTVPVNPMSNTIDIQCLQELLGSLSNTKTRVVAIVGIAGTTETGNIDDLQKLAKICKKHKIWFHVDAAWGGPLLLSENHRFLLKGIEHADSVTIDGHKLFYLPMSHGMVVFKNPTSLQSIRHSANYIIRKGSLDLGKTSLEGSRRFDTLKLWMMFQCIGKQGYAALVETSMTNTRKFAELIKKSNSFVVTNKIESNILTYSYVPHTWKRFTQQIIASKSEKKFLKFKTFFDFLNEVNTKLQKIQRLRGKSFVSRTVLESVCPPLETVVLRAVIFNPMLRDSELTEILEEQKKIGDDIVQKRWAKCKQLRDDIVNLGVPPL